MLQHQLSALFAGKIKGGDKPPFSLVTGRSHGSKARAQADRKHAKERRILGLYGRIKGANAAFEAGLPVQGEIREAQRAERVFNNRATLLLHRKKDRMGGKTC